MKWNGPVNSMKRPFTDVAPSQEQLRTKLTDAGDRAQNFRGPGLVRVGLGEIGFWDGNRGFLGISSYHAMEVVQDCMANKTKLQRYQHVDLVTIPTKLLQRILEANRVKCETDKCMPRFSPNMKYVCATKTHFTHAHKLFYDSQFVHPRILFNQGDVVIKLKDDDIEGHTISNTGVLAAIYSEGLLLDDDAMCALAAEDNLNANVQMGEDEMQAFGRVHAMVERFNVAPSQDTSATTIASILASLEVSGLGTFTQDNWKDFIKLRFSLPKSIAKLLQLCQFEACAGRVRVKPVDFGLVGQLDPRVPWVMVGCMLSQYLNTPVKFNGATDAATFNGLKTTYATKLSPSHIQEIKAEVNFVIEVETFIKDTLQLYKGVGELTGAAANDMLRERGQLLANCGRYVFTMGRALEGEVRKAGARRVALSQDDRVRFVNGEKKGKLNKVEESFRAALVKKKLYTPENLPIALYPVEKTSPQVAGSQDKSQVAPSQEKTLSSSTETGGCLTHHDVFTRLNIKCLGEEVAAQVKLGRIPVKIEESDETQAGHESQGEAQASHAQFDGGSQPSDEPWSIVKLTSLNLPEASLNYTDKDGRVFSFVQCVDDLRPVSKIKVVKETKVLHPSLQIDGTALDSYDYEFCEKGVKLCTAQNLLTSLHCRSIQSVEDVLLYRLSKEDSLPIILQARAKRQFKKGTLILSPLGTVVEDDAENRALLDKRNIINDSMIKHVEITVGLSVDKRKNKSCTPESSDIMKFLVMSPALDGRKQASRSSCLQNLAPFWAVLGCAGPRAIHNMELEIMSFREHPYEATSGNFPKLAAGAFFSVRVPVLRNCSNIEEGEVLCTKKVDE